MGPILNILSYVLPVLGAIMILVFIHELGHFLFAKLFKMRVEKFSVGFPPKVIGKQYGETEYVLGLTPLGGYVKITGMVDESMDTDFVDSEPKPYEFRAKPVWQRIIVIVAGVVFNVILAAIIFIGLKKAYGESYIPAENIDAVYVEEGSFYHKIGLRTGDRLVALNGEEMERFRDYKDPNNLLRSPMTITVEREGQELTFTGPEDIITQLNRSQGNTGIWFEPALLGRVQDDAPADTAGMQRGDEIVAINDTPVRFWHQLTSLIGASEGAPIRVRWHRPDSLQEGAPDERLLVGREGGTFIYENDIVPRAEGEGWIVGVGAAEADQMQAVFGRRTKDFTMGEAIVEGTVQTGTMVGVIGSSLGRLFSGRENFSENIGGPIAIARETRNALSLGWGAFWHIVAVLSITLAIVNILPIPALDGGHLVFLIYEGITRREPSVKVRMVMQQVGMLVLLVFMTFLIFNDVLRIF